MKEKELHAYAPALAKHDPSIGMYNTGPSLPGVVGVVSVSSLSVHLPPHGGP